MSKIFENIGNYNWNNDNINTLKSSIKHSILSYIQLFISGFLHGDFHPRNVILKKTDADCIDYTIIGIGEFHNIPTNGIRAWNVDFENMKSCDITDKYVITNFYFTIKFYFIMLQKYIDDIDKLTLIPLDNYINMLCLNGIIVDYDDVINILDFIDEITLST